MFANFAMYPPEITSGLIYTGPGSASLWAAAQIWEQLATDLQRTAPTDH